MHDVRRAIMAPMLRLEDPDIGCRSESCVLDEGLTGLYGLGDQFWIEGVDSLLRGW
jgi:hypothetical protein